MINLSKKLIFVVILIALTSLATWLYFDSSDKPVQSNIPNNSALEYIKSKNVQTQSPDVTTQSTQQKQSTQSSPQPINQSTPKKVYVEVPVERKCNELLKSQKISYEDAQYRNALREAEAEYKNKLSAGGNQGDIYGSSTDTRAEGAKEWYDIVVAQINRKHDSNLQIINSTCY